MYRICTQRYPRKLYRVCLPADASPLFASVQALCNWIAEGWDVEPACVATAQALQQWLHLHCDAACVVQVMYR